MTMNEIKKGREKELVVLVDTETSRENVSRAAASQGWTVKDVESRDGEFRLTIWKDR